MDFRAAQDRIVVVQSALTISSPDSIEIAKAYKTVPDRDQQLPDLPCWINTWAFTQDDWGTNLAVGSFVVRSQLFLGEKDLDRAADQAAAFFEAWITAFRADVTLAGAVTSIALRGANPTLVMLEWGGQSYMGLDLFMDLIFTEGVNFEP
jgi:hypothetical protein